MGNRATITTAPFNKDSACIYVHWNGGRESVEAFCAAAKELGYRAPGSDDSYALARLTGLICTFFGLDADTSIGIGTVRDMISAGGDNGCFVLGGDWEIVERRNCNGRVIDDSDYTPPEAGSPYATMAEDLVAQVRRAGAPRSRCGQAGGRGMITPKININGSSVFDLIEPRQQAWRLIDEVVEQLQRATPNGRDYPGNDVACTADREEHYDRIAMLRKLQDILLHEALSIKDQEI